MLELPDIKSSEKKLQEYYTRLSAQHVMPAWIGGGIITEPRSEAVPHLWRWARSAFGASRRRKASPLRNDGIGSSLTQRWRGQVTSEPVSEIGPIPEGFWTVLSRF
jgi:hypothetical protein